MLDEHYRAYVVGYKPQVVMLNQLIMAFVYPKHIYY